MRFEGTVNETGVEGSDAHRSTSSPDMKIFVLGLATLCIAGQVHAQDFYDPTVLRTVDIDFHDANWWALLQANYASQTNILADMTVDGVVYTSVGVRIRGNTSYTALPPGSQKVSLNIETDFVLTDQEVLGYSNLNFNNAFTDPSFCREVVYSNLLAEWIPNGRANHVVVRIEGQNWGVYANVQQFDKRMLRDYFDDEDGMRIKCPNNPNGPGLQYVGTNPNSYNQYEVKFDGGLANPIDALIAVCRAVDTTAPANWTLIDRDFAIDPSIWTVVLENLCADDDSYINKGADFVTYRDPIDGRTHLLQTDGNETFKAATWSATYHFTQTTKPVLNNVLAAPELRQRYFAHMRTVLPLLDWAHLEPIFTAHRQLIDAAVQADPKKLYTYSAFQNNFTTTVNIGGSPPFGGNVLGLKQYVDQRRALLLATPELVAPAPTITELAHSTTQPNSPVHVTARVVEPVAGVAGVKLHYRRVLSQPWTSAVMLDDGLSGDGAAGDGVFGALLPFQGLPGERISYYVGATAANSFGSMTFEPKRTEIAPVRLDFDVPPSSSDIVINEVLARNTVTIQDPAGAFEDYVELYNRGSGVFDLSGMYLTDKYSSPTEWQFPTGTTIGPGQTLLIWADEDLLEGPLHADFKLSADGESVALYEDDGVTLVTSLDFGPQQPDVAVGALVDGSSLVHTLYVPTPGASNQPVCGIVRYDQIDPSVHPLALTANGTAAIGTLVAIGIENAPVVAPAFIGWGLQPAHAAVPTGVVLIEPAMVVGPFTTDVGGEVAWPVVVPNEAALVGLAVFLQAAAIDGSNVVLSNGLEFVLCP